QACHRAQQLRRAALRDSLAEEMVRDLIVVVQEHDAACGRRLLERRAARLVLPAIALSLVEEAVLRTRDEFLGTTRVVAQVAVASAAQRDLGSVMDIVVPHRIDAESAALRRQEMLAALGLVLRRDDDASGWSGGARLLDELGEHVPLARVEDRLGRVEPQAVEMELANPIACIADHEIARALRKLIVEVECVSPLGLMPLAEVVRTEAR